MARSDTLILEIADYRDPQHWRWVLKDSSGRFLQDQEVSLDIADPNYSAFLDLERYLDSNSSPDKRITDQERILYEISKWIGLKVFGKVADKLAGCRVPTVVRVLIPPEASGLIYLPLELARVNDRALSLQDISLVFETTVSEHISLEPIGDKLRMLAIFSLPTDVSVLALRRERYDLIRSISRMAQTHNFAIELRVMQYGVTRDNLRQVLEEGEGWDIIHISGHGKQAILILEKPDGTRDDVSSKDLAGLLSLARGKLKLVSLSSCLSAAATIEETLKWLNIQHPKKSQEISSSKEYDGGLMPSLAQQLVTNLDCAILAMRYPVGDEFAIKLSAELYERLLGKGQTLPRALQLSLREALKSGYNAASPPLSLATPALFGQQAVELILKPPQAPKREFKMPTIGLAYFPPEPIRFVGRSGPLGRASSALAPESDKNGVLFHGMAGAGKTACALELAYHHSRSHRFQGFVWYKAPDEGRDIDRALLHLAIDMEAQLPGFKMVHVVDDLEAFKNFMPLLKQFVKDSSILIVLDSLESLLTQEGNWRDERWKLLIETLIQHDGYSRVILTSRRIPEDLNTERLILEPIHALSLSETLVLAREMPNLGRMLLGQDTIGLDKGRELVMRTLSIVQGHPKLIEMADARAGDPGALEGSLEKAAQAWGSKSRLESFFEEERSSQDSEKFLDVLKGWAQDLSETLPEASRAFFHVLCALEETDRENQILEQVWPNLWKQLGLAGQAQSIEVNLGNLNALVKVQSLKNGSKYIVHPSIAEAGLEELENGFRKIVDEEMARFFSAFFEAAKGKEMEGMGKLIVRAGLSATPYLMRLNRWSEATKLLQEATKRDSSPNTIASALIILRRIIEATTGTDAEQKNSRFLARLLIDSNRRRDAENILRPLIANCVKSGELVLARAAATDLFIILRDSRPREALELAEKIIDCTIKLGLGPWTQIEDKGLRLQALNKLGRYPETLKVVMDLRAQMDALPELSEQDEVVEEWNVKEVILSTAQEAAINSGSPDQILDLTAELFEIRKARGAPELEIARGVFGNYSGLIRKGKYDAAEKLLLFCRDIFEKEKDVPDLVKVFGALSIVMDVENQPKRAVDYGETALRYAYLANSVEDISIMHNNLGNYFSKAGLNRGLSHHLAEGILSYLGDKGIMKSSLRHISIDLSQFGSMAIPTSFDQLCQIVEEVDGVLFRDLFYRLAGSDANGDQVMQEVLRMAQESI